MTPVFCCGFECGQLGSVGQHFTSATNVAISTVVVRSGARSLRTNLAAQVGEASIASGIISNAIVVARFYVYFTTLPNNIVSLWRASDGSELGGAAFNNADNKIYARGGSGLLGATGVSVTTGQWYRIDVRHNCTSNPRLIDVQVDGVACGQRSDAFAATTINSFFFPIAGSATTTDFYLDDLVVSQTSADYPIGAGKVEHFVAVSDGSHNISGAADFRRGGTTTDILNATTDAYLLVDDVPLDDATPDTDDHIRIVAPANATDYVECIYGPAPGISTPTVAPRAVEVIAEFFAAGTGLSDEVFKLNDNGTVNDVYNGTGVAGTTTGIYKRKQYALAPTGGEWTVVSGAGNFNNVRFRYGYATDANPDKSLMCTMIEAEFAEIPAIPNKIIQVKQAINRSNSF